MAKLKLKFKTEKEIEEMLAKELLKMIKKDRAKIEKEENNGVQSTVEKPVG